MHMIKWLSANEIKAVHRYLPKEDTALKNIILQLKQVGH